MTDKFYEKQLKTFGIESQRIVKGDLNQKRLEEHVQSSRNVVKNLMSSVEGRQWLYYLMEMCKTFTSPFVPGQPDVTAFFSGAQALGHKILEDIMLAAPESYYIMMTEEQARRAAAPAENFMD